MWAEADGQADTCIAARSPWAAPLRRRTVPTWLKCTAFSPPSQAARFRRPGQPRAARTLCVEDEPIAGDIPRHHRMVTDALPIGGYAFRRVLDCQSFGAIDPRAPIPVACRDKAGRPAPTSDIPRLRSSTPARSRGLAPPRADGAGGRAPTGDHRPDLPPLAQRVRRTDQCQPRRLNALAWRVSHEDRSRSAPGCAAARPRSSTRAVTPDDDLMPHLDSAVAPGQIRPRPVHSRV